MLINSDQADASLQRTDQHAEKVGGTLGKSIGTAAKWGVGIAVAGVAAVGSLIAVASKSAATAASIDDMAQRTNLSSKTLQEFGYAAEQSGTSMEVIEKGAIKLTKTMAAYKEGNKATVDAFKQLGLSAEDSNGKLKSTDEMYPQIIAKLAGMKDITERNALSMQLFGKSGAELGPLLNEGAAGIEAMKTEAGKLGLVLSTEAIAAGAKFDDEMAKVTASLSTVTTKIGLGLMPIVSAMLTWVTANMPTIQAVASTAFKIISDVVKVAGDIMTNTLMPAFRNLWAWIEPNIPIIKQTMKDAFDTIKTVITNVSDAIKIIVDWCIKFQNILIPLTAGVVAAGVAYGVYTTAIKIASLATKAWTVVTTAFGVVMAFITSPIGIVVIAIGLLVVAGVLLYKNWDVIKSKATIIFGAIGKFIGGIADGIKSSFKGMVNGVIGGLNFMIGALNKLKFTIPDWVPGLGGKGFGFNIPRIPSFAIGTRYLPEDMLVQAHKGEMIVPKNENPYANSNGKILNSSDKGGFSLYIETFVDNRKEDIEELMEEMAFIAKKKGLGGIGLNE